MGVFGALAERVHWQCPRRWGDVSDGPPARLRSRQQSAGGTLQSDPETSSGDRGGRRYELEHRRPLLVPLTSLRRPPNRPRCLAAAFVPIVTHDARCCPRTRCSCRAWRSTRSTEIHGGEIDSAWIWVTWRQAHSRAFRTHPGARVRAWSARGLADPRAEGQPGRLTLTRQWHFRYDGGWPRVGRPGAGWIALWRKNTP
jgi:hypothetical protein